MSTSFTKQRAEASSTALFTEKLPEIIKEMGSLESRSHLEEYISRIVIGICRISVNKRTRVFRLPEERNELHSYLEQDNPEKEIVVDLSPVAICLCVSNCWMYTFQKKY